MLFITFIKWYKKKKNRIPKKIYSILNAGNNGTEEEELSVANVLSSLTDEKQKIVRLKFWAHMDFKQIAEYLNKGEAVVRKSYYNSLLALKNRLR